MRKIVYTLLALITVACSKNDNGFSLKGEIKGIKQGKLYLQQIKDTLLVNIDSVIFDGQSDFLLKADIKEPEMLYLYLDRGETNSLDNSLQFFAESNPMSFNTSLDWFYKDAKFTGSKNQELMETYQKNIQKYKDRELELIEWEFRYKKLGKQQKLDSIFVDMHKLMRSQYLYVINFASSNNKHEVAPFIAVNNLSNARTIYLDTIYNKLPSNIASSKYGKMLDKMIKERKKLNIE
jgi:hypothetical protein